VKLKRIKMLIDLVIEIKVNKGKVTLILQKKEPLTPEGFFFSTA
jgi:hypothetical protein